VCRPRGGDIGDAEGGRLAGGGTPLRVAARRAVRGDRPRARRVQAAGAGDGEQSEEIQRERDRVNDRWTIPSFRRTCKIFHVFLKYFINFFRFLVISALVLNIKYK